MVTVRLDPVSGSYVTLVISKFESHYFLIRFNTIFLILCPIQVIEGLSESELDPAEGGDLGIRQPWSRWAPRRVHHKNF